jgi:uncharacterized protein (TIGR03435 family)
MGWDVNADTIVNEPKWVVDENFDVQAKVPGFNVTRGWRRLLSRVQRRRKLRG